MVEGEGTVLSGRVSRATFRQLMVFYRARPGPHQPRTSGRSLTQKKERRRKSSPYARETVRGDVRLAARAAV